MPFEGKVTFTYYKVGCTERLLTTCRINSGWRSEVSAKYWREGSL